MRPSATKIEISGMSASQDRTPPDASSPAMRGPMMYPRPRYYGVTSQERVASGILPVLPVLNQVPVSRQSPMIPYRNL
jgi:hypothetical protein